mmetsp:Transcript_19939/g.24171  ORF Transcript_19939/g.24171 Transcript_19939/m.24171 type:complete len:129 (-) Transcript_19939:433-819(-)
MMMLAKKKLLPTCETFANALSRTFSELFDFDLDSEVSNASFLTIGLLWINPLRPIVFLAGRIDEGIGNRGIRDMAKQKGSKLEVEATDGILLLKPLSEADGVDADADVTSSNSVFFVHAKTFLVNCVS